MIEIDVRLVRSTGFTLSADFVAPGAGVTSIFGRSGSGKTTVIQMVAGSVTPDTGIIRVDGETFFDAERRINLPIEKRRVGYVFQDARLFPHLSVTGNLRYGEKRARGVKAIGFDAVVEMLGIGHLLARRPHTLSGGEKQRVAIGRALLSQPRLLLMDEPLASLDEQRKAEILPYIERLREELHLPVLYVSHALEEVVQLSDMMVAIKDGTVVAAGPLAEVMLRPDMLPVIGRFDVGALIDCTVKAHDPDLALSTLAFADGELRVPLVDRPVGAPVRARIRSRDVALSLSPLVDVSVTNHLAGRVGKIIREEGPYASVEVRMPNSVLRASVTMESVGRLGLEAGMPIWAMIKAVAVDSRSPVFAARAQEITAASRPVPALPMIAGSPPTGRA